MTMTNDFNYSQGNVQEGKKDRKGFGCCGILLLMVLVFIIASCFTTKAQAQATATPEPTADLYEEVEIDEEVFAIEKTISYGEIAVVAAALGVITIFMIYAAFQIITHYLR